MIFLTSAQSWQARTSVNSDASEIVESTIFGAGMIDKTIMGWRVDRCY
jgi:hypothetical protein